MPQELPGVPVRLNPRAEKYLENFRPELVRARAARVRLCVS